MGENRVGYRFRPTEEELINHYLKNKILGNFCEIGEIREININDHDPESLLLLSRIDGEDMRGYFFARVIKRPNGDRKRSTPSGSWEVSGKDRDIEDKDGNVIGLKRGLAYRDREVAKRMRENRKNNPKVIVKKKNPKGNTSPWVIHEYVMKNWDHPYEDSYMFCKIKYKGEDGKTSHSLPSDPKVNVKKNPKVKVVKTTNFKLEKNPNLKMEKNPKGNKGPSDPNTATPVIKTPLEVGEQLSDEGNGVSLDDVPIPIIEEVNLDDLFNLIDEEERKDQSLMMQQQEDLPEVNDNLPEDNGDNTDQEMIIREDHNDHRPKKPFAGIIVVSDDDDDDDDAESISVTSYPGALSPGGDSVGSNSSNTPFSSDIDEEETLSASEDLQTSSADSSISRENTESQLTPRIIPSEQEVNEDIVTEKKKSPHYVIGLILLVAFIGTIVSGLSTVET